MCCDNVFMQVAEIIELSLVAFTSMIIKDRLVGLKEDNHLKQFVGNQLTRAGLEPVLSDIVHLVLEPLSITKWLDHWSSKLKVAS